jgi:hypothetical protein
MASDEQKRSLLKAKIAVDARKTAIAQALYNDKTNSIADICRTLRISRATLYRHVTTGPDGRRPDRSPATTDQP